MEPMSTNNHIDLIELPASSPEEVKAVATFMSDVFGWQFKEWGSEYSDTQDSGVAVGVNGTTTKEQAAPLAVIYTEDLEATKDKIVTAGGKITHDISDFPGGRRFAFTDPAGNQLAAWGK
jgi:predicted enzyme related to lactoylglutathione lyase